VPPAFEPPPPGLGITDVTAMSLDAMASLITRFRLATLPPDVLVTVPGDAARTMDFHRAHELIDLGRDLTASALDEAFAEESQLPVPVSDESVPELATGRTSRRVAEE
jgi:NTE family protein